MNPLRPLVLLFPLAVLAACGGSDDAVTAPPVTAPPDTAPPVIDDDVVVGDLDVHEDDFGIDVDVQYPDASVGFSSEEWLETLRCTSDDQGLRLVFTPAIGSTYRTTVIADLDAVSTEAIPSQEVAVTFVEFDGSVPLYVSQDPPGVAAGPWTGVATLRSGGYGPIGTITSIEGSVDSPDGPITFTIDHIADGGGCDPDQPSERGDFDVRRLDEALADAGR